MANSGGESVQVNLELKVQDESCSHASGDGIPPPSSWKSVGPVQLLVDDKSTELFPDPSDNSRSRNNNHITGRRDQLPRSVKALLLPSSTIISAAEDKRERQRQRKASYLFRHAPAGQPNTNLLILLHGAGDTHVPFDKLGQTMALPQTATLALSAQGALGESLPLQLGYTWLQEMDYTTGDLLPESQRQRNLEAAASKFYEFLLHLIVVEQWIIPERVFMLGYGAGGALAMQVCVLWNSPTDEPKQHNGVATPSALGGAICVAGGASGIPIATAESSNATPILLMVGENDESFPPSIAKRLQQHYGHGKSVEVHIEPNKGQGMIQSPTEMHKVMEFLSQRLVRFSTMPMP